jgi:uncharacterized membrane protein (UPF0127 family)
MLLSCNQEIFKGYQKAKITLVSGQILDTYVAITAKEQSQGLSGLKKEQFKDNNAMLFPLKEATMRQFWMPNTHFDLDIFFLNKDFLVIDIHRNLAHYPKKGPKHMVPLSKMVYCNHVLEVKSSSTLSKQINIGDFLKIESKPSFSKILLDTRLAQ